MSSDPKLPQKVLLIQENHQDAASVCGALVGSSEGPFQIERVRSCAEGVQRLVGADKHSPPGAAAIAAVLVDLFLPDSEGIETFDRLFEAARHIPILVLVEAKNAEIARLAVRRGAQDFILKDRIDNYWLPKALRSMAERAANVEALFEEKDRAAERTSYLAQHDGLTDLPNRTLLNDRLAQAMAAAHRRQHKLAVLFLDLDHFKHINDSLGRAIGDRLLQSVARRLLACVRNSDTVSRQGGDEFIVLLAEVTHAADAGISADKILASLNEPHRIDRHEIHVTVSIGIGTYPDDAADAPTLLKNADFAMHQAKDAGRNNYQFFQSNLNIAALERHTIELGLRHAIERRELILHYQPQMNLATGAVSGVEALLRWRHPTRGLLSPAQFMSVAEETGMIVPIGRWVLAEACRQAVAWQRAGLPPLRIAVNVSAVELRAKGFVEGVGAVLRISGLEPRWLELELTETFLMLDSAATGPVLQALKDLGVHLALDDFGTGYSSLSYMRRYPLDTLKIDHSFVRNLTTDADDASIVSAVINMGHSLHMLVVAEGVETTEQAAVLRAQACPQAQGYYFSQPVLADDFARFCARPATPPPDRSLD
jgi:diguanylate cyclase (GGDEF)-like protein